MLLKKQWLLAALTLLTLTAVTGTGLAQNDEPPPTPAHIILTPEETAAAVPTEEGAMPPDHLEPNDTPQTAAVIGWQTETGLSLSGQDQDYITGYLKAGQLAVMGTTVYGGLDTVLTLYWAGQPVAGNDDRSATDTGSQLSFTAPADGWYVLLVGKATFHDGSYDLTVALAAPTAVPTGTPVPTPTVSPTPLAVPSPAPSPSPVSGSSPAAPSFDPPPAIPVMPTVEMTAAVTLTAATPLTLTVRYLGEARPPGTAATTRIRLLVYYDANNDRQPGPGEGVANVSVLAVDGQGKPLARIFTNAQGEAVFNLDSEAAARIIVPFVPGWSARIRAGEASSDIVLGLPAVRLPVFLPVQNQTDGGE